MVPPEQFAVMPFPGMDCQCGDWELNSGVGGLSVDFMPTAPCADRLPRHSIRISSNRGLYCIYCAGSGVRFPARLYRLNQIHRDKIVVSVQPEPSGQNLTN